MSSAAAVETSAPVKTATEAGLPAGRETSGGASMIKTTESAGMSAGLGMRTRESMLRCRAVETWAAAVKSTGVIEIVAIDENSAVGYVAVVVKHDPVVTPIVSPVPPAPAKPAKEADSKAEAKRNSRTGKE